MTDLKLDKVQGSVTERDRFSPHVSRLAVSQAVKGHFSPREEAMKPGWKRLYDSDGTQVRDASRVYPMNLALHKGMA